MPEYLIHQSRNGTPLGIFSEVEHYYPPEHASQEAYGEAVIATKGSAMTWDEFVEQQASKSPAPKAMWDIYESDKDSMEDIFQDVVDDTSYGE